MGRKDRKNFVHRYDFFLLEVLSNSLPKANLNKTTFLFPKYSDKKIICGKTQ